MKKLITFVVLACMFLFVVYVTASKQQLGSEGSNKSKQAAQSSLLP